MATRTSGDVRISTATPQDAFAMAALHLQHDVAAGAVPEAGFLDRYADWWLTRRDHRPAWIAKTGDGDPVGVLTGLLVDDRPAVGRRLRPWLHLTFLFVSPRATGDVAADLIAACQAWASGRDVDRIAVRDGHAGRRSYARAGFTSDGDQLAWQPTTR